MKRTLKIAALATIAIAMAPTAAEAQNCASGDCGGSIVSDHYAGDSPSSAQTTIASDDGFAGDMPSGAVYGQRRGFGQPDLFYNYYTQGNANAANAQMYLSPGPIPPNVGHTFYTYQPFYPHHMLYAHQDRYHNYYDGGRGLNRTKATYYYPPVRTAIENLYWNVLRIPR